MRVELSDAVTTVRHNVIHHLESFEFRRPALGPQGVTVMRLFVVPAIYMIAMLITACGAGFAHAGESLKCESRSPGGDAREIECSLPASGAAQRFHFKSNFAGSHDDTTAALTPSLNGSPMVCDQGSKTSLMGEDGEVSLDCRFAVTEKAGARLLLQVKVVWRHAQYLDSELKVE